MTKWFIYPDGRPADRTRQHHTGRVPLDRTPAMNVALMLSIT
jgi:hypothetical protein